MALAPNARAELAAQVAQAVLAGFDRHYRLFRAQSALAKQLFERAQWSELRAASRSRIDMYDQRVKETVAQLAEKFPGVADEAVWPELKRAYTVLLLSHQQPELAETFFNSVTCRVLHRRYYRNEFLFWRPAVSTELLDSFQPTYRCYYPATTGLKKALGAVLSDLHLANPWEDQPRDLGRVLRAMARAFPRPRTGHPNLQVQVLSSLFFRNKAAYVVGRVVNGNQHTPFALPILQNSRRELYLDALLLGAADLSPLFSLARSYFLVDMEVPSAFVSFLRTLLPDKPVGELYTALGLQKQGKTALYRELFEHLKHSSDHFVVAPGVRGMVMVVFTLPSFPYVFKVIRDHFAPPKDTEPAKVREQYRRVKLHDRVGRMADTLEYSDVALPLHRFDPALLAELRQLAPSALERDGEQVVIRHLYLERRMTPLDMYLAGADDAQLRHGVDEYGRALRELAGADIFPGDLLLKNFGVTRVGRVVFYDYDELSLISECRFRRRPTPRDDDDELSAEPWFYVDPQDVFPEELPGFIFSDPRARSLFLELHGDLATPEFWQAKQAQLAQGQEDDIFPYPPQRRFPRPGSTSP